MPSTLKRTCAAVVLLAATPTLHAVAPGDGRTVIRHIPTILDRPGSYVLAKSFVATHADDRPAIRISATGVDLDLNGQVLDGAGGSTARPGILCEGGGTIHVHDGVLTGWTGAGIRALETCSDVVVEDLRVVDGGPGGIHLDGPLCRVSGCEVARTGGPGISVGTGGVVEEVSVAEIDGLGISLGERGRVRHGRIRDCDGTALDLATGAQASSVIVRCPEDVDVAVRAASQGRLDGLLITSPREGSTTGLLLEGPNTHATRCRVHGGEIAFLGQAESTLERCAAVAAAIGYEVQGSILTECEAVRAQRAYSLSGACTLDECRSQDSGAAFESDGEPCSLRRCLALGPGSVGFAGFVGGTLESCHAVNFDLGFSATDCVLRRCRSDRASVAGFELEACRAEGCTAAGGSGGAFRILGGGSRIESCRALSVGGTGFEALSVGNVIVNNLALDNGGTNYDLDPGNVIGPITTPDAVTSPLGNLTD